MDQISLDQIYQLERRGLLVTTHDRHDLPDNIVAAASDVRQAQKRPSSFTANTATSAAAWLVCTSNSILGGNQTEIASLGSSEIDEENGALAFRGQALRYPSLIPTACRDTQRRLKQKQPDDEAAMSWLWPALQYFHDQCFKYDPRNGRENPTFWIGREETMIVAQHHGLGTQFLDWTFDPLVALAFAAYGLVVGEQGVVVVRAATDSFAVLPPTFLNRLWHQSGFVEEQWCRCSSVERSLASCAKKFPLATSFHHIVFSIGDATEKSFFDQQYDRLMKDDDHVGKLVDWSVAQSAARGAAKLSPIGSFDPESLRWFFEKNAIDPPEFLSNEMVLEDVSAMWKVLEQRAVRAINKELHWDLLALGKAIRALSFDATAICMRDDFIEKIDSPICRRLVELARVGGDRLVSVAKYSNVRYEPLM